MEFHEKLQELRKQKGLTQEALAQALYVSRTAVSKWESGRGYPNIDSLKAIAKFYKVTVDELLSGEELLTIAQEDTRQKQVRLRALVYGLMDCSAIMFLFLPVFAQRTEGVAQACSLLNLSGISAWLKILYFAAIGGMILWGVLTLALQNCQGRFWQHKTKISLILNAVTALLCIVGLQPYAAALLFIFFMIKGLMLAEKL